MLNWILGKSLNGHLYGLKKVKIGGFRFTIKKLSPLNYLEGAKVLTQKYDTYAVNKGTKKATINEKKIIEHISQVICYAVESPKITLKKEEGHIHVDDLFIDEELVMGLYSAIMEFTYGKKKIQRKVLAEKK